MVTAFINWWAEQLNFTVRMCLFGLTFMAVTFAASWVMDLFRKK